MKKIKAADYQIMPGRNQRENTWLLQRLLGEIRGGEAAELLFDKGEYHFYPDYAEEKLLFISNHDEDTIKRVAFDLTGQRNLQIAGAGSSFIFHSEILPFHLEHCVNVELTGFSVDYERPLYSEGIIREVDKTRMRLYIDKEEYPYYIAHQRIFFTGENFCNELSHWMEVDIRRGAPSYDGNEGGFSESPGGFYGNWREIEENVVEVTLDHEGVGFPLTCQEGNVIILRHHPRSYPGIFITDSKDIVCRDLDIYHCAGMGVIAQLSENILLEQFRVTCHPQKSRHFTIAADGAQFVCCRGLLQIKDCLFEGQLDDGVNIHGIYTRIDRIISDTELVTQLVHHQHKGVRTGEEGDVLSFLDHETMLSEGERKIVGIRRLNKDFTYIELDRPIPEDTTPGDVLENRNYVPDVIIENSIFRKNRARGILLTSGGKVSVSGNLFQTSGSAILVEGDAADWFESGAVNEIHIVGNVFDYCDYATCWGEYPVQVSPTTAKVIQGKRYHKLIEISNNWFRCLDERIIKAFNLERLIFRENYIGIRNEGKGPGECSIPNPGRYSECLLDATPGPARDGQCFELKDVMDFEEEDNIWEERV